MTHERAWERLPDLLGSRNDTALLAHVAGCHICQRQLFLLGRVDRMLREARPRKRGLVQTRRASLRTASLLAVAGAVVAAAVLVFPRSPAAHGFVLHAADGRALGSAKVVPLDRSSVEVSLVARGMAAADGDQLLLWAQSGDGTGAIPVGRFMVERGGECRAQFRLPTSHRWTRFWITSPARPGAVVAST